MPEPFDTLAKQIAELSPIEVEGHQYDVCLAAINERTPSDPDAVTVLLKARHGDEEHTGELRISRERLTDPDLPDLAIEIMVRIVSGDLPPGARQML